MKREEMPYSVVANMKARFTDNASPKIAKALRDAGPDCDVDALVEEIIERIWPYALDEIMAEHELANDMLHEIPLIRAKRWNLLRKSGQPTT